MKTTLTTVWMIAAAAIAQAQQPTAPKLIEPGSEPPAKAITDAKPEPIKPAPIKQAAKPKAQQPTTIDCDVADMDLKKAIYTYTGNVVVDGPQFHLTTDGVFTVYMKKTDKPAAKADAKGTPTPKPDAKPAPAAKGDLRAPPADPKPATPDAAAAQLSQEPGDEGTLDHATAVGKEVVIVKTDAEGKVKIGKCRNAYYDARTGDMILRDWPQVQDGDNVIIASEASTVMTLTKEGKFLVKGRTRSEIAGSNDSSKKGKGEATPGAPSTGGGGISIPTPAPRRQQ